jgi:hypothetical protein
MSDGTNDRGAKPPRTLFSLGRPGAKAAEEPAGGAGGSGDTTEVADVADVAEAGGADVAAGTDETFSGYLCGACEAPLPIGAVFCAECGTPVASLDDVEEADGVADADAGVMAPADAGDANAELADEAPMMMSADVETPAATGDTSHDAAMAGAAGVAAGAVAADLGDGGSIADEFVEEPAFYDSEPVLDLTSPAIEHEAAGASVETAAGTDTPQPAAVLYADPSQAEPLPAKPEGTWGISEPGFGSSEGDFVSGEGDDTGGEVGAAAWAAPVAATAAVEGQPAGATPVTGLTGTTAASMPYGHGPVHTSEKKNKTGLMIGAAAAAILLLVIGGIALAAGGKKDGGNVSASQSASTTSKTTAAGGAGNSTTTKAGDTTTSTEKTTTTTTKSTTSTTEPATTSSDVAPTSAVTTPTFTVAPTIPPTPAPTPAPTLAPGRISPIPANGATITIAKGGTTQIILQNVGALPASCTISVAQGNLSLNQNCSPSIPPGGSVTITVKANPGFEGAAQISGLMEGVGAYNLNVFVKNG